jgi:RimJ/RimL family protein N-acetyltransferase
MFAGYVFFRSAWGTPEIEVLGMLGLAYLFSQFRLLAIHGQRYPQNGLTARFMRKYGSKDVGTIPHYMLRDGKLESCTVSTLLQSDFESYVKRQLLSLAGEGILNERQRQHTGDQPSDTDSAHHG